MHHPNCLPVSWSNINSRPFDGLEILDLIELRLGSGSKIRANVDPIIFIKLKVFMH